MHTYSAKDWLINGGSTVTICGSTKFFHQYLEAQRRITFMGNLFYTVGSFGHSYNKYSHPVYEVIPEYETVKKLHFLKISKSNCLLMVSDESMYIGESVKAEIKFAESLSLPVFKFDGDRFLGSTIISPPKPFNMAFIEAWGEANGGLGY